MSEVGVVSVDEKGVQSRGIKLAERSRKIELSRSADLIKN